MSKQCWLHLVKKVQPSLLTSLHTKKNSSTTQPRSLTSGAPHIGSPLCHHCFLTSLFWYQDLCACLSLCLEPFPSDFAYHVIRASAQIAAPQKGLPQLPYLKYPTIPSPSLTEPSVCFIVSSQPWHYPQLCCLFGYLFIFCLTTN